MDYYMVVIQREPHRDFQPYSGWDTVVSDRGQAEAMLARAVDLFYDAKIVSATPDEAVELGWIEGVVTYRHAYLDRRISLCREHADSDHPTTARIFGTLGPVERGAHRGTCAACFAESEG